ncbi:MAG: aspartate carbamoyltransferase catalytic subunit [Pseudomonadota bacterium]
MSTAQSSGWAPYLDPDERLLWEGAPLPGIRFRASDIPKSLFGSFFGGFALFWIYMASTIGGNASGHGPTGVIANLFPLFGLPFLAVGGYMAFERFFWEAYVRTKTRYALTDKRGFVAKSALGRKLESWPITPDTQLEYQPGEAATLFFAQEEKRGNKGRRYTVKRGFEYIANGEEIYRLMRQVQQGTLPEADTLTAGLSTWRGGTGSGHGTSRT